MKKIPMEVFFPSISICTQFISSHLLDLITLAAADKHI